MPLGPRLVQLPPAFFPLNPCVLAVAGPEAARLVFLDPAPNDSSVVRQVG